MAETILGAGIDPAHRAELILCGVGKRAPRRRNEGAQIGELIRRHQRWIVGVGNDERHFQRRDCRAQAIVLGGFGRLIEEIVEPDDFGLGGRDLGQQSAQKGAIERRAIRKEF